MSPVRYLAQPILKIGGSKASDKLMEDLMEISVEESLHQPAMFTIAINNDYFPGSGEPWQHESQFSIGKKIEVSFKSSTTEASEFSTENEDQSSENEAEIQHTKDKEAGIENTDNSNGSKVATVEQSRITSSTFLKSYVIQMRAKFDNKIDQNCYCLKSIAFQ